MSFHLLKIHVLHEVVSHISNGLISLLSESQIVTFQLDFRLPKT